MRIDQRLYKSVGTCLSFQGSLQALYFRTVPFQTVAAEKVRVRVCVCVCQCVPPFEARPYHMTAFNSTLIHKGCGMSQLVFS